MNGDKLQKCGVCSKDPIVCCPPENATPFISSQLEKESFVAVTVNRTEPTVTLTNNGTEQPVTVTSNITEQPAIVTTTPRIGLKAEQSKFVFKVISYLNI